MEGYFISIAGGTWMVFAGMVRVVIFLALSLTLASQLRKFRNIEENLPRIQDRKGLQAAPPLPPGGEGEQNP
ncbi:MAG: hypothetical protein HQL31_04115 [Planctomycetes bacterium]|nr:hypothetical protein [Planctomycetota bacterium]